jgi:protein required for attachment to host cells
MTDIRIPAGALVLIVDGKRARFLRNKGTALRVRLETEQVLEQDNPPTHEQGSDRPGRFLGSDRVSRSAVEQTDWHQLAEDRFAVRLADLLYRMGHAREFEHLVIAAPPKTLGALRSALHPEVAARILAEVPKDLARFPEFEIANLL